jgi:hypothetical protein
MKLQLTSDSITTKRIDVVLLICSFASSMVDVVTFNDLGIFVSNQVRLLPALG